MSRIQNLLDKIGLLRICFKVGPGVSVDVHFCATTIYESMPDGYKHARRFIDSLTKKAGKQPVKEQKPKKTKKDKNKKAQNLSNSCIDSAVLQK